MGTAAEEAELGGGEGRQVGHRWADLAELKHELMGLGEDLAALAPVPPETSDSLYRSLLALLPRPEHFGTGTGDAKGPGRQGPLPVTLSLDEAAMGGAWLTQLGRPDLAAQYLQRMHEPYEPLLRWSPLEARQAGLQAARKAQLTLGTPLMLDNQHIYACASEWAGEGRASLHGRRRS